MNISNQFDNEPLEEIPNIHERYYYNESYVCGGFTLLMKLVLLTRKYEEAKNIIRKLLNNNPDIINIKNGCGMTALMLAALNINNCSTDDTIKILVDAGANLNLQDDEGTTALMMVTMNDNNSNVVSTIQILIDAGANLNLQKNNGVTVLGIVLRNIINESGDIRIVKILIDAGIDLNLQNCIGETVLIGVVRHMDKCK